MISRKNAALFIAILSIILVLTGLIYGFNNKIDLTNYLTSLNENNILLIQHGIIIILFFISTLSILGVVLQSIYIGIESISIGYLISQFILSYNIKGLIYSIITIFVNKFLYILILMYLFITSITYIKKVILNIVNINNDTVSNLLKPLIKKYIIILVILFIYDLLIYLFGNMFLNYLTFML